MKLIDYSPSNENLVVIASNDYNLKVINDNHTILFNTEDLQDQYFPVASVSFTHDGNNIVIGQPSYQYQGIEKIVIIPYNELIQNNLDASILTFSTDIRIINYKVSPNNNHIAILFFCNLHYSNSIHGLVQDHQGRTILHVYDFTPGHQSLVFEKIFNHNEILFSLSNLNTIAIVRHEDDLDEDDIDDFTILSIYDLITGDNTMNKYLRQDIEYRVSLLEYYPELVPNHNNLVCITTSYNGDKNMRILDLEHMFEEIYNKPLDREKEFNSITINTAGNIALGTDNGLELYHTFDGGDDDYDHLFINDDIHNMSFSSNNQKIGVSLSVWDEQLQMPTYISKIYDIEHDTIIYNSADDYQVDEILIDEPEHVEIEGIAFEIHNAFQKINLPNLVEYIHSTNVPIITDIQSDSFLDNIQTIFNRFINEHFSDALREKKDNLIQHLTRVLEQIRGINYNYNYVSIGMLRWEFLRLIISFVMIQEVNFVENYLETFIEDSYRAYSSAAEDPDGNISCPKGIIERFVLSLHTASILLCPDNFSSCPSPYKELIYLLCSAVEVHINWAEIQSDWFKSGINKIPMSERKDNFIRYMTHRAEEICPNNSHNRIRIQRDADEFEAANLFTDENINIYYEGGMVWLSNKYFK